MTAEDSRETGDSDKSNELLIRRAIEEKLAHISIEQYQGLPRKTKKAARKARERKPLTSQEQARLQSIRPKPEKGYGG